MILRIIIFIYLFIYLFIYKIKAYQNTHMLLNITECRSYIKYLGSYSPRVPAGPIQYS